MISISFDSKCKQCQRDIHFHMPVEDIEFDLYEPIASRAAEKCESNPCKTCQIVAELEEKFPNVDEESLYVTAERIIDMERKKND